MCTAKSPSTARRLRSHATGVEGLERRACPAAIFIEGGGEVTENGGSAILDVRLSAAERKPVTVTYFIQGNATGGRDFRLATGPTSLAMPRGIITFRPGETSKTITLHAADDLLREGTESASISLFGPRNATLGANTVATVMIRDNDDYSGRVEGPSTVEEAAMGEYSLVLSSPATKTETFYINTAPGLATTGSDFRPLSQLPLVFNPGESVKRFRIQTLADDLVEYDEYFLLNVTPSSADFPAVAPFGVTIGGIGPVPPPSLSIDDITATEGNDGLTAFVFTVRATAPFGSPIKVSYATSGGSATASDQDFNTSSGTLTIEPGQTARTIRVDVRGDTRFETDETFSVVLSSPVNATLDDAIGVGTITNDDIDTATTFQITVRFPDSSLTASQRQVFEQAAARWSQVITADLPDVTISGRTIDDVEIEATAPRIDGAGGVLGQAGPTGVRNTGSRLPYQGIMQFDAADVAQMERDRTFLGVILHEMGHVIGIGSLWRTKSLVIDLNTSNPQYIGVNGLREYRTLANLPSANGVPVEAGGGRGTAGSHWRESVFDAELMTGYAERAGTAMPISRLTIGSLEDIGYTVNYGAADPYTLPAPAPIKTSPLQGGHHPLQALRSGAGAADAAFAMLGQSHLSVKTSPKQRRSPGSLP